jgi:hypothetical protein
MHNTFECYSMFDMDRSYTNNEYNYVTGVVNTWSQIHEFGHLLGLGDKYVDVQHKFLGLFKSYTESVPLKGYEGSMMGQYDGIVNEKTLNDLLKLIGKYVDKSVL